MPFIRIDPSIGRPGAVDAIGMSALKTTAGAYVINIYIGPTAWEQSGFSEKQFVNILEGVDYDAGSLLMEATKSKTGYKIYRSDGTTSRSMRILATRIKFYEIVDGTHKFTTVDYTVNKSTGILIQVPEWLRYKSMQVPKPARSARK